eukprot:2543201-Rhodomonas_salina.2
MFYFEFEHSKQHNSLAEARVVHIPPTSISMQGEGSVARASASPLERSDASDHHEVSSDVLSPGQRFSKQCTAAGGSQCGVPRHSPAKGNVSTQEKGGLDAADAGRFSSYHSLGRDLRLCHESGEHQPVTSKASKQLPNLRLSFQSMSGLELAAWRLGYARPRDLRRFPDQLVPDVPAFLESIARGQLFETMCISDVETEGYSGDSQERGDSDSEEPGFRTPRKGALVDKDHLRSVSPPRKSMRWIPSHRLHALIDSRELYHRRMYVDPAFNYGICKAMSVHGHSNPIRAISMQMGQASSMAGGGRKLGELAGLEFLRVIPQKQAFEKKVLVETHKKLGIQVDDINSKPSVTRVVIEMEQQGISHKHLEGLKALCPTWWIPCRQGVSRRHQELIGQTKQALPFRELKQGYATDVAPLLRRVWTEYLSQHPRGPP